MHITEQGRSLQQKHNNFKDKLYERIYLNIKIISLYLHNIITV